MDFDTLMAHKGAVIAHIARDERAEVFEEAGVAVRHGGLRFPGPHEAIVDGASHRFEQSSAPRLCALDNKRTGMVRSAN